MSKTYKARRLIQVGDDIYEPGDVIKDAPLVVESWVYWGDVEVVDEEAAEKTAKKAATKKTTAKKAT